jgi:hypothetical protein
MGSGLVIGFSKHLQVVTTVNYYTVAALHNLQSLHTVTFQKIDFSSWDILYKPTAYSGDFVRP